MYGNYSYPINGNVQQNLAQQRMNNLQNQYNQMFPQQEMMQQQVPQQMQMIKGRPVSSLEEARASMIDLDGSMYVFTDVTKEIKKVNRMCEQLNGTGYDSVAIHNMQDKYHEKYKKKYNEEYTDKEVRKLKEQNKHK